MVAVSLKKDFFQAEDGIRDTAVSLVGSEMCIRDSLKAYEAWGLKKLYGKESYGTLRTTYVIDEDGIIIDAIGKVNTKDHTTQILGSEK